MSDNIQKKIGRNRPPRVQITYDVEIGDAIEMKELPFVMGVIADLSGSNEEAKAKFKDRKFVEIDAESFNTVMSKINPKLDYKVAVPNPPEDAAESEKSIGVELSFNSIDDFGPEAVIKQVPELAALYEARQKLRDLEAKLDGNDELDALLKAMITDADNQAEVKKLLEDAKGDE